MIKLFWKIYGWLRELITGKRIVVSVDFTDKGYAWIIGDYNKRTGVLHILYEGHEDLKPLIVAGKHCQYITWCRENNTPPCDAKYLSSPQDTMGRRGQKVILVGEWWFNPLIEHDLIDRETGIIR